MIVVYHLSVSLQLSRVLRSYFRLHKFIHGSGCVPIREINNIGLFQVSLSNLDR